MNLKQIVSEKKFLRLFENEPNFFGSLISIYFVPIILPKIFKDQFNF